MILEGRFVIEKAFQCSIDILLVVISEESDASWLEALALPVQKIPHTEICDRVGYRFHHGSIAVARRPVVRLFNRTDDTVIPKTLDLPEKSLCLWNITDPSNVGALIRTAAGLGLEAVLLGPGCADPYYRKSLRASMGNACSIPLYSADTSTFLRLRDIGCHAIAATLSPHARPLSLFVAKHPSILVLGNEGFGIPREIVDLCDDEVFIPMKEGVDSLNVVVAGGILMYGLYNRYP